MRGIVIAVVLCGLAASAGGEGRVTVELGDAKLAMWVKGSESWMEVNGTAKVTNGLSVPIEQLEIAAQMFQTMNLPSGPKEMAAGSGSQSDWLAQPLAPGSSAAVPLKMRITGGGLLGERTITLSAVRIGTGKKATQLVGKVTPANTNGVMAMISISGPLSTWAAATGIDAKSSDPIVWRQRGEAKLRVSVQNNGNRTLRQAELSSEATGRLGIVRFPEGLLPGEAESTEVVASIDLPLPGPDAALGTEAPAPLSVAGEIWSVDPAPVLVQKATALKDEASPRGKSVAKLKKGAFVVELREPGGGWVLVRTSDGVRGFLPEKSLEAPLKRGKKAIKKASVRVTADGRYIQLCGDALGALGIHHDPWNNLLSHAGNELRYTTRDMAATTKLGAVTLDPAPYRTGLHCPTLHERHLREHLGVILE